MLRTPLEQKVSGAFKVYYCQVLILRTEDHLQKEEQHSFLLKPHNHKAEEPVPELLFPHILHHLQLHLSHSHIPEPEQHSFL
jgi:hypothetical protein